ncbi:MAG TPA: copper resistance protein CopC, partial [Ilumatobacteraceae bacterium]|nr:copper resistance protein CopC [Ilumatobacteraceae bacterium]
MSKNDGGAWRSRAWLAVWTVVLAAVLGLGFGAKPALAHAQLLSTDPAAGAVLDEAPAAATMTYSEAVDIGLGSVRLFNGAGKQVDIGDAYHPEGRSSEVRVDLPDLAHGSYVIDWRVVSDDGHPIQGAFTFQVGPTSDLAPGVIDDIIDSAVSNGAARAGLSVARGIVIAAIAVLFGGLVAVAFGIVAPTRRLRITSWIAVAAGTVFGLVLLPLEVGYAKGRGLGVITDSDAWSTALGTRIGTGWLVRALIMAVVGSA